MHFEKPDERVLIFSAYRVIKTRNIDFDTD